MKLLFIVARPGGGQLPSFFHGQIRRRAVPFPPRANHDAEDASRRRGDSPRWNDPGREFQMAGFLRSGIRPRVGRGARNGDSREET